MFRVPSAAEIESVTLTHINDSTIHAHNKRAMRVNVGTSVSSKQKNYEVQTGAFAGPRELLLPAYLLGEVSE
jgi:hypothetical protein